MIFSVVTEISSLISIEEAPIEHFVGTLTLFNKSRKGEGGGRVL